MKNVKQYYKELGKLVYAVAISDGCIQKEEVERIIASSFSSGSSLTVSEWKKIASQLNLNGKPHSWFIIREEYIRYG